MIFDRKVHTLNVCVVNEHADTHFSRIYLRKQNFFQNPVPACSYLAQVEFFDKKKCRKSLDTVSLTALTSVQFSLEKKMLNFSPLEPKQFFFEFLSEIWWRVACGGETDMV